jgi:hypothetical protein
MMCASMEMDVKRRAPERKPRVASLETWFGGVIGGAPEEEWDVDAGGGIVTVA